MFREVALCSLPMLAINSVHRVAHPAKALPVGASINIRIEINGHIRPVAPAIINGVV